MRLLSNTTVLSLIVTLSLLPGIPGNNTFSNLAIASEHKTQKVPAMRERVYSQLARAQQIGDEQGAEAGLAVLDEVHQRVDQMNSYERAMLFNFYGFTYYGADRISDAITAFEKVVAEVAIPESLTKSTLFSLAQLAMSQNQYDKALSYLTRWQSVNDAEMNANEHLLFAQLHYQLKNYQQALPAITQAIALVENDNKIASEHWLVLQRAIYFELQQPHNVAQVLEKMVRLYNKPQYWIQLAGMYGELGEEKKQLAVMESAMQAGFITSESDITTLAQLYLYHDIPYKSAALLSDSIESGALTRNLKNLQTLAQAWLQAKETDKAIISMKDAALLSDDGNNDARLAEVLLNQEKWQEAITTAEQALEKGRLKNEGNMHMVLGIAYFNRKQFDDSLIALSNAGNHPNVRMMAEQWATYVSKEQQQTAQLAMIETSQ